MILLDEDDYGRKGERCSLVMLDRGTQWLNSFPAKTHSTNTTHEAFLMFASPHETISKLYTDNAAELINAAKRMRWRHDRSTPNRPQTNGTSERAVKRLLEGTRASLAAANMPHCFWPEASRCYAFLRNVTDKIQIGRAHV